MSDALGDILGGRAKSNQPPEFAVIRRFMSQKYQVNPMLALSGNNIIIGVPSAAVAGSLRMEIHQLSEVCHTKRRLIIRIG